MNKRILYYLAVAFQIGVLLILTASFYLIDIFGEEVVLKTEPVDPRDLFYGDYVTLHYDIQTIDTSLWKSDQPVESLDNKKVYVVVEPCEEGHCASGVYTEKPDTTEEQRILSGKLQYVDKYTGTLNIIYGIERYFVPEGEGKEIEQMDPEDLRVIVKVAPWGQMKITDLRLKD